MSFCYTTKWISYVYTYIPSLLSFPPTSPSPSSPPRTWQSSKLSFLCYTEAYHSISISHMVVIYVSAPPSTHPMIQLKNGSERSWDNAFYRTMLFGYILFIPPSFLSILLEWKMSQESSTWRKAWQHSLYHICDNQPSSAHQMITLFHLFIKGMCI